LLLLPILALLALMLFMTWRSNRNRQQKMLEVQSSLVPGAEVMTNAGMFATVIGIEDDKVVLEPSPGVEMTFLKAAIAQVVKKLDEDSNVESGLSLDKSGADGAEDES
jgi:preprotein translocase subunit YajC